MKPRCILFVGHRRCHRRAAKRMGDYYCCCSHGRLTVAIAMERLSPATRRMLAYAQWETAAEGQARIDRMLRREAAA